MPAILNDIVKNKRSEIEARKSSKHLDVLKKDVTAGSGSFARLFQKSKVQLICELKPKSPSAGVLQAAPDIDKILSVYNQFATAISVLTDEKYFGGSLELLTEISSRASVPTLCKDFILDPYQCYEARLAGALAVLLIVKILDEDSLGLLHQTTQSLGMTPVVEVQTETELGRALSLKPEIILINNRNLESFEVDFQTTRSLAPRIPESVVTISASGISERSDIEQLLPYCSNFLVGSSLMLANNLADKLKDLSSAKVTATGLK